MKIYGTLKEVVSLWLKSSGNNRNAKITVAANPSTDNVEYQLPNNSTNDILVTDASSSVLTNKTFNADGTGNSITNIENADIKSGAAIDATKIGAGSVDNTEFGYLNGVTSAIQTQLGNKAASGANSDITSLSGLTTALSIGQGGSGQTTANTALNAFLPSQTSSANKYLKTDGTNTSWASASGGAGEINAILNASGADGTTGWTGTSVVSGASSPLNPIVTTAFSIANSATSESSTSGGYYPFTMPAGLLNKKLKVEFTFATPATDVYRVSVYKSSTRVALSTDSSSVTTLPASTTGKYVGYFDTDSNTSWTLSVTRTSGSTGACVITNVIVGPGIQPQGAVVSKWTSYTPTIGNVTTSSATARYKQDGTDAIITAIFTTSAAATGNMTVSLPSGLTVDTTALPSSTQGEQALGSFRGIKASGSPFNDTGTVVYFSTTAVAMQSKDRGTLNDADDPWTSASGDKFSLTFRVPISEWAGSGTVDLAQNDVEYAYNTSATTANDTSSFGYGPAGFAIQAFAPSGTNTVSKRIQWQRPSQNGDTYAVEVYDGTNWIGMEDRLAGRSLNDAGTTAYGFSLTSVSSTQMDVNFFSAPFVGLAWSAITGFNWRVRKSSPGAAVGFGIADTLSSGLIPAGTYNKSTTAWTLGAAGPASVGMGVASVSGYNLAIQGTTSDATLNRIAKFNVGGNSAHTDLCSQTTTGITTATIIAGLEAPSLVMVRGTDGTNEFFDLLISNNSGSPTVVSSATMAGSPSARTYSISSFNLRVALASGTYTTNVTWFQLFGR